MGGHSHAPCLQSPVCWVTVHSRGERPFSSRFGAVQGQGTGERIFHVPGDGTDLRLCTEVTWDSISGAESAQNHHIAPPVWWMGTLRTRALCRVTLRVHMWSLAGVPREVVRKSTGFGGGLKFKSQFYIAQLCDPRQVTSPL